jgi:flagellar hook-associated protein 2
MSSVSAVNSALASTATTTPTVNISQILAASVGATTPGIDVSAAVAAALYADRASERVWQAQQATLAAQTTALTAIQTATTAVTTDLASLNTLTGPLAARTVTSSNISDLTATAASGTVAGNHAVVVQNLATTASWYSDLATSATSTLPTSSFTVTNAAGTSAAINTGTGTTGDNLTDLASTINGLNLGLTATVVSDSTGSRLAILSNTAATAGNFSINAANYTGTAWSSPDIPTGSTLGANSITLTPPGGSATTISTTSGETYAQLAATINGMNLGVTATAGSDANGTSLSISSNSSSPFTISEPSFGYSEASVGANANLTVDGVPISSASNAVTGAIPGVTLNLLSATSGSTVNLTVASDASQVSTAVNQFVTDYNTAISLVNAQFASTGASSLQGPLGSDPTVRSLQISLEQALNYVAPAPATGTATVSSLSDLGLTLATDGTLTVNSATMNAALVNSPSAVQNFFQGASLNGFANSVTNALSNFTNPGNGAFTVDLSSFSSTSASLTSQISEFELGYIANQQTILTAEYSAAEIALQTLPTQMAQIQAELGVTPSKGG